MNDLPRQKLVELVRRHGKSLVDNPRRAEGLFRDYFGEHRREISVLTLALEEHVALDLLAAPAGTPRGVLLSRLSRRLCDNLGLSEEAANWAVNSWALALGVISIDDLKTLERQSSAETPKVPPSVAPKVTQSAAPATTAPKTPRIQAPSPSAIIVSQDGSGNFISINQAVRAAASGARILVRPGLYEESLTIDKQIEIVGDGAFNTIVLISRNSSCISMQTDRAIVRNLTVQCAAGNADIKAFAVDITHGEVTLQNCDIVSNSLACVAVRGRTANPLIRDCRIHDSANGGISFFDSAAGTIEECEIYRNQNANVVIAQSANPLIKNCRIFQGGNSGFWVYEDGLGTIDDCDIYGHAAAEVAVSLGGSPVLRRCKIHNSNSAGVFVNNQGRALLEDCSIFNNADAGLVIDGRSIAAISRCNVKGNGKVAIRVKGYSSVRVENSDLRGNLVATWDTEHGVFIENNGNLEY